MCGKFRPGHFNAVVDVIDRFIAIINPKRIYFGQKDLQQLMIINHFVKRNHKYTKVIECKTIREKNGIACSSRNVLLTLKEKIIASKIYKLLKNKKHNLIKKKLSLIEIKRKILKLGVNKIEYITFATSGNSTDFGDMTSTRTQPSGCSDAHGGLEAYDPRLIPVGSGRAIVGGGAPGGTDINTLEYFNINTLGNATDFGDLVKSVQMMAAYGSHTRGIWHAGKDPGALNDIQSVELHSLGNAADFGDATVSRGEMAQGLANRTRGLGAGGTTPGSYSDVVDYITIATAGNATDFGNLTAGVKRCTGSANSTRGLFGGGYAPGSFKDTIDYFTIASTGDATDFGNLVTARQQSSSGSSATRAIVAMGGETTGPGMSDEIDLSLIHI